MSAIFTRRYRQHLLYHRLTWAPTPYQAAFTRVPSSRVNARRFHTSAVTVTAEAGGMSSVEDGGGRLEQQWSEQRREAEVRRVSEMHVQSEREQQAWRERYALQLQRDKREKEREDEMKVKAEADQSRVKEQRREEHRAERALREEQQSRMRAERARLSSTDVEQQRHKDKEEKREDHHAHSRDTNLPILYNRMVAAAAATAENTRSRIKIVFDALHASRQHKAQQKQPKEISNKKSEFESKQDKERQERFAWYNEHRPGGASKAEDSIPDSESSVTVENGINQRHQQDTPGTKRDATQVQDLSGNDRQPYPQQLQEGKQAAQMSDVEVNLANKLAEQLEEQQRRDAQAQAERGRAEEKRKADEAQQHIAELERLAIVQRIQKETEACDRELAARVALEQEHALKEKQQIIRQATVKPVVITSAFSSAPTVPLVTPSSVIVDMPHLTQPPDMSCEAPERVQQKEVLISDRVLPYMLIATGFLFLYLHNLRDSWGVDDDHPIEQHAFDTHIRMPSLSADHGQPPVEVDNEAVIYPSLEEDESSKSMCIRLPHIVEFASTEPAPLLPSIDYSNFSSLSSLDGDEDYTLLQLLDAQDKLQKDIQDQEKLELLKSHLIELMQKRDHLVQDIETQVLRYATEVNSLRSEVELGVRVNNSITPSSAHSTAGISQPSPNKNQSSMRNHQLREELCALKDHLATITTTLTSQTSFNEVLSQVRQQVLAELRDRSQQVFDQEEGYLQRLIQNLLIVEAQIVKDTSLHSLLQDVSETRRKLESEEKDRTSQVLQQELLKEQQQFHNLTLESVHDQREQLEKSNDVQREARLHHVDALHRRVRAFRAVHDQVTKHGDQAARLHQFSMSLLALDSLVFTADDFMHKLNQLRSRQMHQRSHLQRVHSNDDLIDAALDSIPPQVFVHGLPSVDSLIKRWNVIKAAMREEAFVPFHALATDRSMLAHLLAKLFAWLYFDANENWQALSSVSMAPVQAATLSDLEIVSTINDLVHDQDWQGVLQLLPSLSEHVGSLGKAWAVQVQDRAITEQASEVVEARVMCLASQI